MTDKIHMMMIDGTPRICCPDCCITLECVGFLARVIDNDEFAVFTIKYPHTFADCRAYIEARKPYHHERPSTH